MQNGETIEKKAQCKTCTCKDAGEMTCQEKVCPILNCEEDQMEIKKDDECCSYCKSISCKSTDLNLLQIVLIQYTNTAMIIKMNRHHKALSWVKVGIYYYLLWGRSHIT